MPIADIITSLRTLSQDGPADKVVFGENLGNNPTMPVDGTNKKFRLGGPAKTIPVVAASVYITIVGTGAVFRTQTGFTLDDATNGLISFTVAPNPGAGQGNGVYADYNYQWFTDAKYTEFLNESAQQTLAGVADPTAIVEGLKEVMLQYALAHFWMSRASQYAERYSSSGGEAGQSIESVAKAYITMADNANKRADKLKLDFYKRQGQREAPAVSLPHFSIDPITPVR